VKLPQRSRRLAARRGFKVVVSRKDGTVSLEAISDFPVDPVAFLARQLQGTRWYNCDLKALPMEELVELLDAPTEIIAGVKRENVPTPAKTGRPPVPIAERLWGRMDPDADPDQCWHWPGSLSFYGYGIIAEGSGSDIKIRQAHIVAYESAKGPVPAGLHIDHLCHGADLECPGGGPQCLHRRCVNPVHLEAVTQAENNRRMHARKTHCPVGHPLFGDNLYVNPNSGHRICRTCRQAAVRRWYANNKDTYNPARNEKRRDERAAA
jgi:hypothetical protein